MRSKTSKKIFLVLLHISQTKTEMTLTKTSGITDWVGFSKEISLKSDPLQLTRNWFVVWRGFREERYRAVERGNMPILAIINHSNLLPFLETGVSIKVLK